MQAEILLTLKLQQKLFADPRRISLLKHIALSGSISQGAKDAGISYKSAWDAINEMNQSLTIAGQYCAAATFTACCALNQNMLT